MTVEEELAAVAADVVSKREHEPIVRKLFAVPPGSWVELAGLVSDVPSLRARALVSCASCKTT